jgi:TolA-binding protein
LPTNPSTNTSFDIFNKLKKVDTNANANTNTNAMQSQINDLNQKIEVLFSMMEQMSINIKKISDVKNE